MDDKLEKKDRKSKESVYDRFDCFHAWVDALGYHFVDLCRYLPEYRK